jgi:hypothetical protein
MYLVGNWREPGMGRHRLAQGRSTAQGADGKGRVERLTLEQSVPLRNRPLLVASVSPCTVYVYRIYPVRIVSRMCPLELNIGTNEEMSRQ